jgi:hypothetical protein
MLLKDSFNFYEYMLRCGNNAVKQQIHRSVLCACTSLQRSKTDIYVLMLPNFNNWAKMSNDFNFDMLLFYTFQ